MCGKGVRKKYNGALDTAYGKGVTPPCAQWACRVSFVSAESTS